jgi:hypothetical protein
MRKNTVFAGFLYGFLAAGLIFCAGCVSVPAPASTPANLTATVDVLERLRLSEK